MWAGKGKTESEKMNEFMQGPHPFRFFVVEKRARPDVLPGVPFDVRKNR
jgi:hypothetical protein